MVKKVPVLIADFSCTLEIAGFVISNFPCFVNFGLSFVSDSEAGQVM
jgi:hypothetical protein